MGLPAALLDQGGATRRLRSLLGVVEEARTRWRRRRRRWLVAMVALCLVSLAASLLVTFGPLSGGQAPPSSHRTTGVAGTEAALAANRWEPISPGPLSARNDQTAVWTGRQLLIWGGTHQSPSSPAAPPPQRQALGDGAAYDPASSTWRTLPKSPLSPRAGTTGVWTGTEAIFWGGYAPGTATAFFADGAAYDPATGRWSSLPPSPLSPRESTSAFWTGSEMLVFGGYQASDKAVDGGGLYRPSTNTWSRLPVLPSVPSATLVGTTVAWTGRQLLVWLTYEVISYSRPSTVNVRTFQRSFSWNLGASSWQQLPAPPSDVFTYGANAVWAGHQVLLIGGSSCPPGASCAATVRSSPLTTYDPTSARWGAAPGNVVATNA